MYVGAWKSWLKSRCRHVSKKGGGGPLRAQRSSSAMGFEEATADHAPTVVAVGTADFLEVNGQDRVHGVYRI